jgi:hypothetical protein
MQRIDSWRDGGEGGAEEGQFKRFVITALDPGMASEAGKILPGTCRTKD